MADTLHTIAETDLASRHAAARLRAWIEERALAGDRVILDLAAVLSISESYSDELFGVLVVCHGLKWCSEHLVVRGANQTVFRSISKAIRYRLETQEPGNSTIALLTARKALEARRQSTRD